MLEAPQQRTERIPADDVVGSVVVVQRSVVSDYQDCPASRMGSGSEHGSASPLNQQGHNGQSDDAGSHQLAPQPPPFNPLLSHNNQGQSLGHSVVPDLMKIYESLTQSKTPQNPRRPQPSHQYHQPMVQQHPQQSYRSTQYQQPNQYHSSNHGPPQPPMHPHGEAHNHQYSYIHPQAQQGYFAPPPPQYGQESSHPIHISEYSHHDSQDSRGSQAPSPEPVSSGRSLRKRSIEKDDDRSSDGGSTKPRKKGNSSDGRWSKRFTWPDDLHRDFVSAIFDVGLKHASPSAILEHMPTHEQMTSERIKSHLQKYRLHRAKSKKDFMCSYDASLSKFQSIGVSSNLKTLSNAEVAAHLTYSAMNESNAPSLAPQEHREGTTLKDSDPPIQSGALMLPKLTEAEKQSPIGASMGYLMGLFFSLRQQLLAQRAIAGSGDKHPPDGPSQSPMDGFHVHAPLNPTFTPFASGNVLGLDPNLDDTPHDQNGVTWSDSAPQAGDGLEQPTLYSTCHEQDPGKASKSPALTTPTPSTRTNLEESHLMKREMQSQMAFQNKMRALKQQELNKYKSVSGSSEHHGHGAVADYETSRSKDAHSNPNTEEISRLPTDDGIKHGDENEIDGRYQGAGEAAEAVVNPTGKERHRGLSIATSEDFWVNDEQLFEFLMNP